MISLHVPYSLYLIVVLYLKSGLKMNKVYLGMYVLSKINMNIERSELLLKQDTEGSNQI